MIEAVALIGTLACAPISSRALTEPALRAATWKTPAGYASLALGGVGVGTWVALLLSTRSDAGDPNAALAQKDGAGKIDGLSSAEYKAQKKNIDDRQMLGGAALGVGIAAIGAGAWMLMTRAKMDSAGLQLRVGGPHLAVAWHF